MEREDLRYKCHLGSKTLILNLRKWKASVVKLGVDLERLIQKIFIVGWVCLLHLSQ